MIYIYIYMYVYIYIYIYIFAGSRLRCKYIKEDFKVAF